MKINDIEIGVDYDYHGARVSAVAIEKGRASTWDKREVRLVRLRYEDGTERLCSARDINRTWKQKLALDKEWEERQAEGERLKGVAEAVVAALNEMGIPAKPRYRAGEVWIEANDIDTAAAALHIKP